MGRVARRSWVWHFDQPPHVLWPVLSDTRRFNEAARMPKYLVEEIPQANGTVLRLGRARLGSFTVEWEEKPFEWVAGASWTDHRLFRKGPFRRLGPTVRLVPEGGGTRVDCVFEGESSSPLGTLLLRLGLLGHLGRITERMVRSAVAFAAGARPTMFDYHAPAVPAAMAERVAGMVVRIEESGHGHGLARRLADHLLSAQEVELIRLRPLKLARDWGVPERPVVELCLAAVSAGLLALRWDLLCPRCRGAKVTAPSLDRLPAGAHCPSCNIAYDRDFARNVELTFHPAAAIRPIVEGEFCLSGPATTPHVQIQQTLAAGETRAVAAAIPAGPWRLRTIEVGAAVDLDWQAGASGFPTVIGDGSSIVAGPPAPGGGVRFENRSDHELTFVIEDRRWVADALTAHRVTTFEAFRELFSDEVLRPGDEVAIGHVTLMFTDLRGSTALYGRVGDARAYRLVRAHFAFLAERVRAHNGAIVKTIGDAVMGAFAEPADAVRAALAIQGDVALFNAGEGEAGSGEALVIKLGLHAGPCVAVTLNGRLDYFGSAVNLAARLQGESHGGDIVLSEALADDPAVAPLIASLGAAREVAKVKGFGTPIAFRRLAAGRLAGSG